MITKHRIMSVDHACRIQRFSNIAVAVVLEDYTSGMQNRHPRLKRCCSSRLAALLRTTRITKPSGPTLEIPSYATVTVLLRGNWVLTGSTGMASPFHSTLLL